MSKGLRFCLVLGIACIILGGGIAGAAVAMGADRMIGLSTWDIGSSLDRSWDRSWDEGWPSGVAGEVIEMGEVPSSTGSDSYTDINKLDIDFSAGNIVIESSGEDGIRIWTDNEDYFRWYQEDNTLKIESKKVKIDHTSQKHNLYISVPQNWYFKDIDIDMAAGNLHADELFAETLDIDMAAGNVKIDGGLIGELSVDMTAGRVSCQAAVKNDLDIDIAAGNVDVWMQGSQAEYNYDVVCTMGNINIGDTSYSGLGQKKKIDNHANKEIEISCSAGNINVKFEN